MNSTQFIEYRKMIESELANACTKHPKFCDHINHAPSGFGRFELWCRRTNDYNAISDWTKPCEHFENRWSKK